MDGVTLNANGGVHVPEGNSLTVWAQRDATANGSSAGSLTATGRNDNAGIGGDSGQNAGSITINGGIVTASCIQAGNEDSANGAGIGGGNGGGGGTVTVNGGKVTASCFVSGYNHIGANGSGIGGGFGGGSGTITVNGGEVTASCGSSGHGPTSAGAGIGGWGDQGSITITGGTVTATAGYGAGIGGSNNSTGGTITVTGGTVTATGANGAGIGGGPMPVGGGAGGTVIIEGGLVTASSSSGAGIGGGWLGGGGTVTVTGGTVTAVSSIAQAIGHGLENDDPGSLSIDPMKVTDPADVTALGRETACRGNRVTRELCRAHEVENGVCRLCGAQLGSEPYYDPGYPGNTRLCDTYTYYSGQTTLSDGVWYIVKENITVEERLTVSGSVNLILGSSATLTAKQGITLTDGNALEIWGQGAESGKLNAGTDGQVNTVPRYHAAIGTSGGSPGALNLAGTLTINSGYVFCRAGQNSASIGGGNYGSCGTVNIYGGRVEAHTDTNPAAGIGGGIGGAGGNVTITGGSILLGPGSDSACIGHGSGNNTDGELNIIGMRVEYPENVLADGILEHCLGSDFLKLVKCTQHVFDEGSDRCKYCGHIRIPYLDPTDPDVNGEPVVKYCADYTLLSAQTELISGWYVVAGDTQIDTRITVTGDVNIILMDGVTLTAYRGINVGEGSSLTIWAQCDATEDGSPAGALVAYLGNNDSDAAIGGNYEQKGGTITINGGFITAGSSKHGAGIGGGDGKDGGTTVIHGGSVLASSEYGAGIGGGDSGGGGNITVTGGAVTAIGSTGGAGIGGGDGGDGGNITITGGTITAEGALGAGIGGGNCGAGGTVIITGGTVTATGAPNGANTYSGAGIGGGSWGSGGDVTISGGTVTAIAGNENTQAIGRGDEYNYTGEPLAEGDLNIDGMKVTDPADVTALGRETACRGASVTLEKCEAHNWGDWNVTTAPTCTDAGEKFHTCVLCGETETKTADALGHDLIHHDAQAPTCTEIGWEAYDTCSRCDYTTYAEIAALGHDLIHHDAKAPTCTEIGWDAYDTCSRCDFSTYVEIPALGHDVVVDAAVAATCTEAGLTEGEHCTRCDYKIAQEAVPALGHDLIHHDAQAPTCTEIGWEAYDACSRCDYTTTYVELPAPGHNFDGGVVTLRPTETATGVRTYTCTVCGATYEEVIPQLDYVRGDVTGDGTLDTKDLIRFMKYLSGEDVEIVAERMDINGDGAVNSKDLVRLMKYLSGENVEIF